MDGKKLALRLFIATTVVPMIIGMGEMLASRVPVGTVMAKMNRIISTADPAPGVPQEQASAPQNPEDPPSPYVNYVNSSELNLSQQPVPNSWNGIPPSNETWENEVRANSVVAANGKTVSLEKDDAILFVAPWSPYSHVTLQLLQQEGLLSKVTIVIVSIDGAENGNPPPVVNNVKEAEAVVQQSFDENHIYLQAANTLFALPQNALNEEIQSYPTLLVRHNRWFYVQDGYVDNAGFWENLLS